MLALSLDNNRLYNSHWVRVIVAIKLTLLEQAKKGGFQLQTQQGRLTN